MMADKHGGRWALHACRNSTFESYNGRESGGLPVALNLCRKWTVTVSSKLSSDFLTRCPLNVKDFAIHDLNLIARCIFRAIALIRSVFYPTLHRPASSSNAQISTWRARCSIGRGTPGTSWLPDPQIRIEDLSRPLAVARRDN